MEIKGLEYINSPLTPAQHIKALDLLNYYKHVLMCSRCRILYGIDQVGSIMELYIRKNRNTCPNCDNINQYKKKSRWLDAEDKV